MKTISKNCLECNNLFDAPIREIKRGNGKFCSIKCSQTYNCKIRSKPQPNIVCAWCDTKFYKSKSKMLSKSGLYFCSKKCKDTAQSISGLKEFSLPHYGDGNSKYRIIIFRTKAKECERCGYNKNEAAIVVHHKDRNRSNNNIENLEVLCANCHLIEHYSD